MAYSERLHRFIGLIIFVSWIGTVLAIRFL